MSSFRPPPDPLENYKKLNADLIAQLQRYKQQQRMFEMKVLQMERESMEDKKTIRSLHLQIESFVNSNSALLNDFLGDLVQGHNSNMTTATDFAQKILQNLHSLLIPPGLSLSVPSDDPAPAATAPVALPSSVQQRCRPLRTHRSLSPVAVREEQPATTDETPLGSWKGGKAVEEGNGQQEDDDCAQDMERFVTKRRRNYSPPTVNDQEDVEKDVVQRVKMTPREPVTLPDGMLSTIAETSTDDERVLSVSSQLEPIPDLVEEEVEEEAGEEQEEDEDAEAEEEAEEEQEVEEDAEEEQEVEEKAEEEQEVEEEPVEEEEEEEAHKENSFIAIDAIASSTPNPRRRVIPTRTVLSPVDPNVLERIREREENKGVATSGHVEEVKKTRTSRKRTPQQVQEPTKRRKKTLEVVDLRESTDVSEFNSSRPRRKAAPKNMKEAPLNSKLRQPRVK